MKRTVQQKMGKIPAVRRRIQKFARRNAIDAKLRRSFCSQKVIGTMIMRPIQINIMWKVKSPKDLKQCGNQTTPNAEMMRETRTSRGR
mmetsp:Transcript_9394/g.17167  ORF Transcript_9394/g.17167 Transcript_9394/m.17167 type:complete len:88 (+) Transcript_9394:1020-1283(+)